MKVNVASNITTHGGSPAVDITAYERLRRTVLACMLFENNFYEDGVSVADRITELCAKCTAQQVFDLALEASEKYQLRHVPLQLIVEGLKHKRKPMMAWKTIDKVIKRVDMMTDLIALYWKNGKKPLPYQLKKGIASAFSKFDVYQFAKYDRDNPIKIRDAMFLCHPKPRDKERTILYQQIATRSLPTADTWETRLSAGDDKKESFEHLLMRNKMGKLAILRNMRNMHDTGVPKSLVDNCLQTNMKPMLPFQYLAAARECPQWEDIIDKAMIASASLKEKLPGRTIVLVDVSGSMDAPISAQSKMMRFDAACGMAILLRETCADGLFASFSNNLVMVPPRQGMALRDVIVGSQPHSGTNMGYSLTYIRDQAIEYDRLIVITDEQATDTIPNMPRGKNYIINIGSYQNGIGTKKQWTTINGFSEACIDYIREVEKAD